MRPMIDDPDDRRTPEEKHDDQTERQMSELMTEVRVVMPGVQVMFAFLLAVPFQSGFEETTDAERVLFIVTLLSAGLASACLIASAAMHRVLFGKREREFVIHTGNRLVVVGLSALAVAMSCGAGLIVSYVWSTAAGWLTIAGGAVLFGSLWFALPLARRAGLIGD
jgi:hypothetical protein